MKIVQMIDVSKVIIYNYLGSYRVFHLKYNIYKPILSVFSGYRFELSDENIFIIKGIYISFVSLQKNFL